MAPLLTRETGKSLLVVRRSYTARAGVAVPCMSFQVWLCVMWTGPLALKSTFRVRDEATPMPTSRYNGP